MVKVHDKSDEMKHHEPGPQSSISSEGSFVVLDHSSSEHSDVNQFTNCSSQILVCPTFPPSNSINIQQPESQSSSFLPGSMPSNLSPEEIQRKLDDVLQENVELKETLHQNNLAMKQQFNTLVMWQEEVFKVHQSHKEKFAETKNLILKLRAENAELKNYLEQSKTGSITETQLKTENAKLKGQVAELQEKLSAPVVRKDHPSNSVSRKEEELGDLVKQLNRQLETAERSRHQLTIDAEHLTAQRRKLERDVAALKTDLETQKEKNQTLQQENGMLMCKVAQCEQELKDYVVVEKDQNQVLLTQEIERLKKALEKALQLDLKEKEVMSQQTSSPPQPQNSIVRTQADPAQFPTNLKNYEDKLQQFNISLEKQSERYASLDSWLQVAAESMSHWKGDQLQDTKTINDLKAEISELRRVLTIERAYGEEKKKHLMSASSQFHSLFTNYQLLLQEWESFHKEQRDKALHDEAYHVLQTKGFSEKLDNLTAQLLCKDEELKETGEEVVQLKDKVKKLEIDNEAVSILKAQVEVYQSDFNAEREARENLAGEKERLAEDLRALQRRNQELLEEIEALKNIQNEQSENTENLQTGWHMLSSPRQALSSSRRQHSPRPDKHQQVMSGRQVLHCPKCASGFTSLVDLEHHVEVCLDLMP